MAFITLLLIIASPFLAPGELPHARNNDPISQRMEDGQSVMKTVFDRFHINYEMSRTHKVGYYKEEVSDQYAIYYLAEGIVDIYIPCNLDQKDNASITPIKARKKVFENIEHEKLLLGNASDMARSSIWRPDSFLNPKNRQYYTFEYMGDHELDGETVAVIDFKPSKAWGNVSGKIYVDKTYYGIVMIEYTPIVTDSKVWKSVSWTENFEFKNGAYELSQVQFNGESLEDNLRYTASLKMSQLDVITKIPESDLFIDGKIPLFDRADDDFQDSFWDGYDFLNEESTSDTNLIASKNL